VKLVRGSSRRRCRGSAVVAGFPAAVLCLFGRYHLAYSGGDGPVVLCTIPPRTVVAGNSARPVQHKAGLGQVG
jgi:hypothetical protein